MRLHSVHQGVTTSDIQTQTGFALNVPASIPVTDPPTSEELQALRTRVDRAGFLRRS